MAAIPGRASPPDPDLASYDTVVVAFSGGKDSIACLIELIERGVAPWRIELHHHDVDGQAEPFIEWPSTIGYCRAVARSFPYDAALAEKQAELDTVERSLAATTRPAMGIEAAA